LRSARWTMKKLLEQLSIGETVRIEGDLDRLGMTDVVLGRVLVLLADPAHAGGDDSVAVAKQLLHDPEAAPREDRALGVFAHLVLLPWSSADTTLGGPTDQSTFSGFLRCNKV